MPDLRILPLKPMLDLRIPPLRPVPNLPLPAQGRTKASNLEVRYIQRNIETDGLDLTVGAGVNNGNTPGGDRGTEGELRGASSALDYINLQSQGDATERQKKRGSTFP